MYGLFRPNLQALGLGICKWALKTKGITQAVVFFLFFKCKVVSHLSRAPREEIEMGCGGPDDQREKVGLRLAHWPAHRGAQLAKARNPSLFVHPSIQNTCGVSPIVKHLCDPQCRPTINAINHHLSTYVSAQHVYHNLWLSKGHLTHTCDQGL